MTFKVSSAVCTGRWHEEEGVPCQDKIAIEKGELLLCCALADGAGTRANSEQGAACVTESAVQYVCANFNTLYETESAVCAQKILSYCTEKLLQMAPPFYELGCTLLFIAVHQDGRVLTGHLGDGVMFLEKEEEWMVYSPPENGEYQNETFFITEADAAKHFRVAQTQWNGTGTFMLMSDGCAACLYRYRENEPASACRTLADWIQSSDEETVDAVLHENMERLFSKHTDDDMSLVLIHFQEG